MQVFVWLALFSNVKNSIAARYVFDFFNWSVDNWKIGNMMGMLKSYYSACNSVSNKSW